MGDEVSAGGEGFQDETGGSERRLFAAMPPLEAKKMLLSLGVTEGIGYEAEDKQMRCLLILSTFGEQIFTQKPKGKYMLICVWKISKRVCVGGC